jgi:toxin ParE1/3/4
MAKFFFTNKAVEDISGIWYYTYESWSEKQADKYYQLILVTCKKISENPELGKNYEAVLPGIRGFRVGKHIIFYREIKSGQTEILRILHERMDISMRLVE